VYGVHVFDAVSAMELSLLLLIRVRLCLLYCCSPETVVDIDGLYYNVGGLLTDIPRAYLNRTALAENVTFDPSAFHFVSFKTSKPEAPFHYRPRRGAPDDIVWPPQGLRLDVKFKAPFWAPRYHQASLYSLSHVLQWQGQRQINCSCPRIMIVNL